MAPDFGCDTTGLAFVASQEYLVTYGLTFVFFILYVVPFRVHFVNILGNLLHLNIFIDFFTKTLCVWNIILRLYQAARDCRHSLAPTQKLPKEKHNQDQQPLQSTPPPKDEFLEETQPRQMLVILPACTHNNRQT